MSQFYDIFQKIKIPIQIFFLKIKHVKLSIADVYTKYKININLKNIDTYLKNFLTFSNFFTLKIFFK